MACPAPSLEPVHLESDKKVSWPWSDVLVFLPCSLTILNIVELRQVSMRLSMASMTLSCKFVILAVLQLYYASCNGAQVTVSCPTTSLDELIWTSVHTSAACCAELAGSPTAADAC